MLDHRNILYNSWWTCIAQIRWFDTEYKIGIAYREFVVIPMYILLEKQ